jgi:hypothetical protein
MYLFIRRARLAPGSGRDGIAWATSITETVNRITGLPVRLFAQVYSPSFGTIGWSTFLPDLGSLEAAGDKLQVDDEYAAQSDTGAKHTVGGIDDQLLQVIHGDPDPARQVEYVASVRTVCASGQIARGMAVGVEIAQRAEAITGLPTMFVAGSTGSYGNVGWITGYADIAALEAAEQAVNGDASFVEFIDREASAVYSDAPGVSTQTIHRRLV